MILPIHSQSKPDEVRRRWYKGVQGRTREIILHVPTRPYQSATTGRRRIQVYNYTRAIMRGKNEEYCGHMERSIRACVPPHGVTSALRFVDYTKRTRF